MDLPKSLRKPIECLMIDNFDSFTWNLYQSLTLLGTDVTVIRNDAINASALPYLDVKRLIISPGPGHPQTDSGISRDAVRFFTGKIPILGVCMGLEVVVDVFGGEIGYAGEIKHGKLSPIRHDGRGIFNGVPQSFHSTRYHSLSASVKSLPDVLAVTAATEESGVIMGVRHRQFAIEAVQYHPESVLSEEGDSLLLNFLNLRGGTWDENPSVRVSDLSLPPFPIEIPQNIPVQPKSNKLPTILEKIHIQRLKDIELAKNTPGTSFEDLETLLAMNISPPLINLVERMRTTPQTSPALMAEIKRASPSKGPIAIRANAAQQALTYALAGASVVSVLTEPHWFKGSLLDMRLARQAIDTLPNRPAILRKDFIVDEYQIAEARLHGADTILLIVAMLPIPRLHALFTYSKTLGMEPLVEVNNASEMSAALDLNARVIGVNNRNLHNFEVDMGTTTRLVDMVRERDVVLCALSGISGPKDVKTYAEQGVSAVLVGEALMRAQDTRSFIRELLGWDISISSDEGGRGPGLEGAPPLVKICGIRTVDEALTSAQAGADMLGLMFVPTSKRLISLSIACRISHAIRERRIQAETEILSTIHQNPSSSSSPPSPPPPTQIPQTPNTPWFTTHATHLSRTLTSGHSKPLLIGVFQNQPLSYILEVIAAAQLDGVQLHGSEPLNWAMQIPVPVVRAFHVGGGVGAGGGVGGKEEGKGEGEGKGVQGIRRGGLHKFVLLDAMRADGLSGGSGRVLDWELARSVVDAGEITPSFKPSTVAPSSPVNGHSNEDTTLSSQPTPSKPSPTSPSSPSSPSSPQPQQPRLPIILAGGLTPSNVASAIAQVRPWAVDVSGGVERPDGSGKDYEKIVAFVRAAKGLGLGCETMEVEVEVEKGVEKGVEKEKGMERTSIEKKEIETDE